jgi:hypothetical protein
LRGGVPDEWLEWFLEDFPEDLTEVFLEAPN